MAGYAAGEGYSSAQSATDWYQQHGQQLQAFHGNQPLNAWSNSADGVTYPWQEPAGWQLSADSAAADFVGEWGSASFGAGYSEHGRMTSLAYNNAAVPEQSSLMNLASGALATVSMPAYEMASQGMLLPMNSPSSGAPNLVSPPSDFASPPSGASLAHSDQELEPLQSWLSAQESDPTLPPMETESEHY